MRRERTVVLKFGSSVLQNDASLPRVVNEVYRYVRDGWRVVAVVSAIGKTTDDLIARAQGISGEPDAHALAAYLATGEAQSVAALALAVDRAGLGVRFQNWVQVGLRTMGPVLDAEAVSLDVEAVEASLAIAPVLIVPGFVGLGDDGEPTLLGRGGSDMTALFIAHELGADRCVLVKDVDGLYERDPNEPGPRPRRYGQLTWDVALAIDGRIVQHKAVRFAKERGLAFCVGCIGGDGHTVVGDGPTVLDVKWEGRAEAVRVGLVGVGTVGGGVVELIERAQGRARVVAAGVRDVGKDRGVALEPGVLTDDPVGVARREDVDVVVETMGGVELAKEVVETALRAGKDVVTANKALIAACGTELRGLAEECGARLLYSAAVGGGVPMLERVDSVRRDGVEIGRVRGVLNGTCNFILSQIAAGSSYGEALAEAQQRGYAEADPWLDVQGVDAAQKLSILAWHAFGVELAVDEIAREGIEGVDEAWVRKAREKDGGVELVAEAGVDEKGNVTGRVGLIELDGADRLAELRGGGNGLVVTDARGTSVYIGGQGAGRYPTAESVVGDVFAIVRARGCEARKEQEVGA